jgi:hypothetical protein
LAMASAVRGASKEVDIPVTPFIYGPYISTLLE